MSTSDVVAPPEVAWLIELIGLPATIALIEARGGTRVLIPFTEAGFRRSVIAQIIGVGPMRSLARARANSYLTVPTVRGWRAALLLAKGGMSHAEIALKVGLTENYVQKLAANGYEPMSNRHNGARRSVAEPDQPTLPF